MPSTLIFAFFGNEVENLRFDWPVTKISALNKRMLELNLQSRKNVGKYKIAKSSSSKKDISVTTDETVVWFSYADAFDIGLSLSKSGPIRKCDHILIGWYIMYNI